MQVVGGKTSFSSLVSPPPPSHSNHQLERLFIDPLLPSASSYPPSTPVSFFSCSLPPFVSRAVGQRERDVTGIKNVRKARMRERCALGAEVSRRDQRANMKGNWRDRRQYMESESVCVCVCGRRLQYKVRRGRQRSAQELQMWDFKCCVHHSCRLNPVKPCDI